MITAAEAKIATIQAQQLIDKNYFDAKFEQVITAAAKNRQSNATFYYEELTQVEIAVMWSAVERYKENGFRVFHDEFGTLEFEW